MKKIFLPIISICILAVLILVLFNYNNIVNKNTNIKEERQEKYEYELFTLQMTLSTQNMDGYMNKIYYKKIENYQEYISFKNICNNIQYMSEEDFNNKYMIITAVENTSMMRLTLGELYIEDNTLYIGLKKVPLSEEFDEKNNGICIIIDNSTKSDKIEVFKTIANKDFMSKYKNIKTLPKEYSIEQALQDNCVVINEAELKNYNNDVFNNFIKDVNNNLDAEVRLIYYFQPENGVQIIDIKYIENEKIYKLCIDKSRQVNSGYTLEMTYNYYEYNNMEKIEKFNIMDTYKFNNNATNEEFNIDIYK